MPTKQYVVKLDSAQREQLEKAVRSNKNSARERTRARILLAADVNQEGGGAKDEAICAAMHTSLSTVSRVRQRFVQAAQADTADWAGVLAHKPQSKRKARVLDGAAEAHLIAWVCGAPPTGRQRWSLHLLRDKLIEMQVTDTVSHETVRQTLKKMNLSRG